jgi:23S rRNA maturation-related 3'-5' exoribonuclease YhaM
VAETGLFKDIEDEVLHAILAHHGFQEFGSPVQPNSKVAWLLHLCDSISARMDDVDKMDISNYRAKHT